MPQQKPTSFIPDSFVPDQKPSSFIPDSFIPDEPKKPDNTLFSRVGEGLSGLKDFASKIIQGSNPYTGQLAREEIGEGLVDPFKQLVSSRPNRDLPNTIAENIARFGTGILGFDYNKLDEDIQADDYGAALGDLVVPCAMLFAGSKLMGKSKPSVKGTSSITELADMIAPDESFNMPKPQQRLLNAPPQPKGLLGPGRESGPRFITDELGRTVEVPDTFDYLAGKPDANIGTDISLFDIPGRTDIATLPPNQLRTGINFFETNLPSVRGRGDLSFGETNPNQSLGYPLDIVPNRLRPRSVQ